LKKTSFSEPQTKLGKNLVNQLAILIKTAHIHEATNVAMVQPTERLINTIKELTQAEGEVSLRLEGDYLFLDEMKLKMDIEGFVSFMFIIDEFKKREIGAITFESGVEAEEIKRFCGLFANVDLKSSDPFESLQQLLERSQITQITLSPFEEEREGTMDPFQDTKELAKTTYFKTVTAVSEVMQSVKLKQAVSFKKAKRVVQSMVDLILQEDSTLLGLTNLRCHDEYTYNHSVNVCILALAMGQRLGYNRRHLSELGMAALFHDLGKSEIPLEVLNKPAEFTEEEWNIMRRHPIFSVKELVRLKGINDLAIKVAIGAFEHHLNYDLSGYPRLASKRPVSLLGRIISIVDCYDALTSSRVYNRIPFPPDRALRFMLNKAGKAFDPVLIKIFVNAIGVYPIGTMVLLNTKEIGVVYASNPNPERGDRPKVKLVVDRTGHEIDGEIIDLSELDPETNNCLRTITKTIDAGKYKIDVSRYFL
jgi:HD-GYP domain-containing protein (c-di-GMP phosphodiesterase class II)